MNNNQDETLKQLPPELRKSHWSARIQDLIEKGGGLKSLGAAYASQITDGDVVLLMNKIEAVRQQKSSIQTAALLVTQLETLLK